MRVAITGGRDHRPSEIELVSFEGLWNQLGGTVLLHGDCPDPWPTKGRMWASCDREMGRWATKRGIPVQPFAVDHDVDGPWPGAGPRRNRRMLRDGRAEVVVAFKGGRGTADCQRAARERGLPVYIVTPSGKIIPPTKAPLTAPR